MKLLRLFSKLDDSEKDFILLAFAFILVALFLIITGVFDTTEEIKMSKIYSGSQKVDLNDIKLNEIQISVCNYAYEYGTCEKIDETLIVSKILCCKKMEKCC